MGRLGENPTPEQTPPPPSSDQTPFQPPPPQGYPNHHENPLSSPQEGYMVNNNLNTHAIHSSVSELPPTSQSHQQPPTYPPQGQPALYIPQQQPPAYPQPASYLPQQSVVSNGSSYSPQVYSYTPSHNGQPQVMTTGTPNWYQPPVATSIQEWSTGLFECCEDPENAIMTFCFPCVTFGQIAEIVDNGQTSCPTSGLIYSLIAAFIGIPCIMSCTYRTKVRSRYNLLETPAPDWVIHFFCEYCALCQEYRELKNRGMDPTLGWQGNLSKHQQMANSATMIPPINQRMTS